LRGAKYIFAGTSTPALREQNGVFLL
jgi:hypothetical protein